MSDELVDQLIAAKAPASLIEAARQKVSAAAAVDDDCQVWEENWTAVQLFLKLGTQWQVIAGMSGAAYLGLHYGVVESQMTRLGIPREQWPEYWDALEVMEQAALSVLNTRKK